MRSSLSLYLTVQVKTRLTFFILGTNTQSWRKQKASCTGICGRGRFCGFYLTLVVQVSTRVQLWVLERHKSVTRDFFEQ